MPEAAFETAVTRLVIDPTFRDVVLASEGDALPAALSGRERRRLLNVARGKRRGLSRVLHKGFRLNKILARTPLCRVLLGDECIAQELEKFWAQRRACRFQVMREAVAFCDFLIRRTHSGLDVDYLAQVAAYEKADLRLRCPDLADTAGVEAVRFEHDPTALLGALREGRAPGTLAHDPAVLVGSLSELGAVHWHVMDVAAWAAWLRDD